MKQDLRFQIPRSCALLATAMVVGLFGMPSEAKKIFKWVDENGKTHFGDQAPVGEAQEIRIPKTSTVNTDALDDRNSRTQKLLDSFQQERVEKKEAKAQAAEELQKRKKNCKQARDTQFKYEHSAFLYTQDDNGERTILGDDEHAKALAEAKADVEKWCD